MSDTSVENLLQTLAAELDRKGQTQLLSEFSDGTNFNKIDPHLVAVPEGRKVENLTHHYLHAAELLQPLRRKGTASMLALESLIDWSNRFKGDTSVLFADTHRSSPSLTCVANYHKGGAPDHSARDAHASHNDHRAVYKFPLSQEWKFWRAVADKWHTMAEFGEMVEARISDFMQATPTLIEAAKGEAEGWEARMIELAASLQGRFGQPHDLTYLGREIEINEKSDLTVTRHPDTGEAQMTFTNTQSDGAGKPLKIPTLYLIAIPVFDRGDAYRLAVRLRYRKSGGAVLFNLAPHDPDAAFDNALQEALDEATSQTHLPLIYGSPEV